jgi:hypothetical protein
MNQLLLVAIGAVVGWLLAGAIAGLVMWLRYRQQVRQRDARRRTAVVDLTVLAANGDLRRRARR